MPRPYKKGLDYFELDCYLDDKFGMIEAEFGDKGFAIAVKLYQLIYRELTEHEGIMFQKTYKRKKKNMEESVQSIC